MTLDLPRSAERGKQPNLTLRGPTDPGARPRLIILVDARISPPLLLILILVRSFSFGGNKMRLSTRPLVGALSACLLLAGCSLQQLPGGNGTPGTSGGAPLGFWWDSGEQQCQTGNMKLVYEYGMQPSTSSGYQWELWYHVKSENSGAGGWSPSSKLYRLYYTLSYPSGVEPTLTGYVDLSGQSDVHGVLAQGNAYHLFNTRVLTLKRSGGAHGIETTWPNSQGCVSS